jgi:hypothetical protein
MNISMYNASVPVFVRMLRNLAAFLAKAEAHATERKIDPAVLLGCRLSPDMFPLARQVQIASDSAKGGAARLAGVEVPSYADEEKTFGELVERCNKTVAFLEGLDEKAFAGSEDREVSWQTRSGAKSMVGLPYLLNQVLPNFYFHVTTAYAILRHNGVPLGKKDFLGN